ncbi:MAG TPA: TrmH family RNA methyltransferase [Candidatus Limnocylindrales bacterium]|nr:TrmH family RNA methyltransferase [Candidatus Limnocylindrales bacterium]
MPRLPELRAELLEIVARELAAADRFFDRCAADPDLDRELDRRLGGVATPLIAALDEWEDAPPEADELLSINAANADRLAEVIEEHGWPGLRQVGADGADAAWMLAQHADRRNEIRSTWLPMLAEAVARGDADPRHLANLTDRVAAVAGERQRFGTIVILAADGEPEFPLPVDDAGGLEARRAAIGLPSVADEAPYLGEGELVPYGPDRGAVPVNQWPMVVEGHVSVEAVLAAGERHVHRIWARRPGDRRLGRLRALARERGVLIDEVELELIEELAAGRTHGGVIALVAARRTRSVRELAAQVGEGSLVVMLDGIEDPYNFGQAVRALYAAGVDGLVIRRSWETATGTVLRASAGTSELLPTATSLSADEAAADCRLAGMRVLCAVSDASADEVHDADLRGGVFLLIGGERRGVTRSFVDEADGLVRIGYGREDAPALGAAGAAAVIAFEALRQRRGDARP